MVLAVVVVEEKGRILCVGIDQSINKYDYSTLSLSLSLYEQLENSKGGTSHFHFDERERIPSNSFCKNPNARSRGVCPLLFGLFHIRVVIGDLLYYQGER